MVNEPEPADLRPEFVLFVPCTDDDKLTFRFLQDFRQGAKDLKDAFLLHQPADEEKAWRTDAVRFRASWGSDAYVGVLDDEDRDGAAERSPLTLFFAREHQGAIDQSEQHSRGELEDAMTGLDENRGATAVKLQYDRPTTRPDGQYDQDVANHRVPVVRRLDDRDVELAAPNRTPNSQDVSGALRQLGHKGLALLGSTPRESGHDAAE
jgi:hypothetical protein